MRRILFLLVALLALASVVVACTPAATAPAAPAAEEPAAVEPAAEATEAPAEEATTEEATTEEAAPAEEVAAEPTVDPLAPLVVAVAEVEGKANVRWYVGLGTGTNAVQIEAQQAVVDAFNASHPDINLILEVIPYDAARDTLLTQMAAGQAPDIVGPVGHAGSNYLKGQFLDLTPFIEASGYDLTQFAPELVEFYQTDEGQVGLPFAVFPGATFFQRSHFDEAGLNYPPFEYGEAYVWPDGTEEPWNWDTLVKVAKILTVDVNGNAPVNYDDSGNIEPNPDFDATQIVQYGYEPQYMAAYAFAAYYGGAAQDYNADDNSAAVPASWEDSWRLWWNGIYGDEPFIASSSVTSAPEFGSGNPFNSGRISMANTQQWYTCCIQGAGEAWDMAAIPSNADGVVNGRLDADTFRALKTTDEPDATWEVLQYLTGEGSLDLLPGYGGLPARTADQDEFYAQKAIEYPFVENWDTIRAGLAYPDIPSAESYRPNFPEVFEAYNTFTTVIRSSPDIDIDEEIQAFEDNLTSIMQRPTQ